MIGLSESQIRQRIGEIGVSEHIRGGIPEEQHKTRKLINQAIDRLASGVVRAIIDNNKKIEEDLRKAGVNLVSD